MKDFLRQAVGDVAYAGEKRDGVGWYSALSCPPFIPSFKSTFGTWITPQLGSWFGSLSCFYQYLAVAYLIHLMAVGQVSKKIPPLVYDPCLVSISLPLCGFALLGHYLVNFILDDVTEWWLTLWHHNCHRWGTVFLAEVNSQT